MSAPVTHFDYLSMNAGTFALKNFRSRERKCCGISLSVGNGLDLPKTQTGTGMNTLMFEIVNKPYKQARIRSLLQELSLIHI